MAPAVGLRQSEPCLRWAYVDLEHRTLTVRRGLHRGGEDVVGGQAAGGAVLAGVWGAPEDDVVTVVNRLLQDGHALPQLVRHGGWGHHLHATEPTAPVADRMAVKASLAIADVVRAGALERLRRCAAAGCDDALVDLTKNAGRRFCDTSCANREHAAAYRARRAAG